MVMGMVMTTLTPTRIRMARTIPTDGSAHVRLPA